MKVFLGDPLIKQSTEEIRRQVRLLLSAAGVGNKLPTPKDDIVACAKLVEIGKLDLATFEDNWLSKGIHVLQTAFSKIKGLIAFRERVIYVNPDIHPAQKTFVTYHEVTHRVLPWHEGLFDPHLDDAYSIDSRLAGGLEQEANIGASLIQFQIDRFSIDIKDLPLGLSSAIHLANLYGASLHSTFRRYVEANHKACALLVLKEEIADSPAENERILRLLYPLQSGKFTDNFGLIDWAKFYTKGDLIYETVFSKSLEVVRSGELSLKNVRGFDQKCRMEVFDNTFNHFVFIYSDNCISSRTKIIIARN